VTLWGGSALAEASHAAFLSYASQDAQAAQRIAEALRAAGIEVWLDQSELRGGDTWDQKIRRQIRECAIFIPIISSSSQARLEGYFRLEWRLADQRTHLMAKSRAFLLPVCIHKESLVCYLRSLGCICTAQRGPRIVTKRSGSLTCGSWLRVFAQ
jgi:hypothetical protein